jgi:hypothetical protein
MSECVHLSDHMIEVLHSGSSWTTEEAAHLASCSDCAVEWRVLQAARALGQAAAGRVDPERLGLRVLAGVADARRRARWQRVGWLGGLAAAAAITLVVWGPFGRRNEDPAAKPGLVVPLAELEGLSTQQLEGLLSEFDAPLGSDASSDAPALGDLGDEELERVLNTLEG